MKIAFIGQKGLPANQGGIEKHVEKLSTKLALANFDITVYSRRHYTKSDLNYYKNVKIVNLPSIKTKNLDAITHTFISSIHALFQKYDIIHYQGVGPSLMSWIPRILNPRTKIITTFHGLDRTNKKWGSFAKTMLTLGEWTACNFAHRTITVSKELKRYCNLRYNRKATYIPNAGSISKTTTDKQMIQSSLSKYNLTKNQYFVSISRLARNKGLEILIESFNKLNTTRKLVIVGNGPREQKLKDLAQDNPNIIFTGRQEDTILKIILKNAYLFIQPSESEGLSIALLEALDNNVPVLVSDIPANTEVIKNWGLIFENKNTEDLLDKLKFSEANHNLIKNMSTTAKKMADQEYNWDNIAKKTIELYKNTVK